MSSYSAHAETATSTKSSAEPAVVFERLRSYVASNPLDFKTTYVVQGELNSRGSMQFFVERPKSFRIDSKIGDRSYEIISDGKVMTIFTPKDKKYAQLDAPARPAEGLSLVTGLMGVESAVLGLLDVVDDIATGKTELQISAGGSETIGGNQCDGYTIVQNTDTGPNTWKVWLRKGETPLPCKLESKGSDESLITQSNEFSWNVPSPAFPADKFVFTPPAGSEKVDVGDLDLGPAL
ncbi:MAG: DUF2092 domain-containing protein [Hyphomicrobiaceae bacterium]|nr:DUF2092 domain-containing protein [Hyphomicrobiaceae bacterium]